MQPWIRGSVEEARVFGFARPAPGDVICRSRRHRRMASRIGDSSPSKYRIFAVISSPDVPAEVVEVVRLRSARRQGRTCEQFCRQNRKGCQRGGEGRQGALCIPTISSTRSISRAAADRRLKPAANLVDVHVATSRQAYQFRRGRSTHPPVTVSPDAGGLAAPQG